MKKTQLTSVTRKSAVVRMTQNSIFLANNLALSNVFLKIIHGSPDASSVATHTSDKSAYFRNARFQQIRTKNTIALKYNDVTH